MVSSHSLGNLLYKLKFSIFFNLNYFSFKIYKLHSFDSLFNCALSLNLKFSIKLVFMLVYSAVKSEWVSSTLRYKSSNSI